MNFKLIMKIVIGVISDPAVICCTIGVILYLAFMIFIVRYKKRPPRPAKKKVAAPPPAKKEEAPKEGEAAE